VYARCSRIYDNRDTYLGQTHPLVLAKRLFGQDTKLSDILGTLCKPRRVERLLRHLLLDPSLLLLDPQGKLLLLLLQLCTLLLEISDVLGQPVHARLDRAQVPLHLVGGFLRLLELLLGVLVAPAAADRGRVLEGLAAELVLLRVQVLV